MEFGTGKSMYTHTRTVIYVHIVATLYFIKGGLQQWLSGLSGGLTTDTVVDLARPLEENCKEQFANHVGR